MTFLLESAELLVRPGGTEGPPQVRGRPGLQATGDVARAREPRAQEQLRRARGTHARQTEARDPAPAPAPPLARPAGARRARAVARPGHAAGRAGELAALADVENRRRGAALFQLLRDLVHARGRHAERRLPGPAPPLPASAALGDRPFPAFPAPLRI